jgi:hypothetical protein
VFAAPSAQFLMRFCADSLTGFAMMSRGLVSVYVMSVRILPPVRNVSRPTAFTPLQSTGRTSRKIVLKKLPTPCPR